MSHWLTKIFRRKPAEPVEDLSWRLGNPEATHPYLVQVDHPFADAVSGMCFHATLQLRTPLRILQRDGQIMPLGADLPDDFEQWMGIWLPKTKTLREMGIDRDNFQQTTQASPIGYINPSEYRPFLLAIREVVEDQSLDLSDRRAGIIAVCNNPQFNGFAQRHGGANEIFSYFHPAILALIPGLSASTRAALKNMGLCTVTRIRLATDDELSNVKGLGPSKIAGIRAFCEAYKGDPDVEYRSEIE